MRIFQFGMALHGETKSVRIAMFNDLNNTSRGIGGRHENAAKGFGGLMMGGVNTKTFFPDDPKSARINF
jgi:hypothetical protein